MQIDACRLVVYGFQSLKKYQAWPGWYRQPPTFDLLAGRGWMRTTTAACPFAQLDIEMSEVRAVMGVEKRHRLNLYAIIPATSAVLCGLIQFAVTFVTQGRIWRLRCFAETFFNTYWRVSKSGDLWLSPQPWYPGQGLQMGILREPRGGCGTLLPGSSNIDDQTSTGDRLDTWHLGHKIMIMYVYRWRERIGFPIEDWSERTTLSDP